MYKLTFPGSAHCGHTLIAAILDSHSEVCIENIYETRTVEDIMNASPKQWDGIDIYSYRLPGQGGPKEPKVVGVVGGTLDLPLEAKYIGVIRNPFDVIGSRYRKLKKRSETPELYTIGEYVKSMARMDEFPSYYMYHERFIADPIPHLVGLSDYLGLTYDAQWIERGAALVNSTPILSRQNLPWTLEYTGIVNSIIQNDTRLLPYKEEL